jgi:hypothetical protein
VTAPRGYYQGFIKGATCWNKKNCKLFRSMRNILWFYYNYKRAWLLSRFHEQFLIGPVLRYTYHQMKLIKCCDMSWPVLGLGVSRFFQNIRKDKTLVSKKRSLYVACFAYRLATIILFIFYQHLNVYFVLWLIYPKLIFLTWKIFSISSNMWSYLWSSNISESVKWTKFFIFSQTLVSSSLNIIVFILSNSLTRTS